jgi:2-polyprenyl-6-methoxyphenol hydroxylase-like FAD-dependent oxidoreductase
MKKILISGGGICGLTAANALQQLDYEVTVFESASKIRAVGAGINLSSNAIKALSIIGLDKEILQYCYSPPMAIILSQKGTILSQNVFKEYAGRFDFPIMNSIHRADLHQVLYKNIANNVQVQTNKRSNRVEQNNHGVELFFEDGTSAKGDYLLVCDGLRSAIRQQLIPQSKPRYAGYTIWRGILSYKKGELDIESPFKSLGKNGQFGVVPMTNQRLYWFASRKAKFRDPAMKAITLADLKERFKDYCDPIPKILELSHDKDLLWNDTEDLQPIQQYAFGKVLLMGDAAHATTPNLGQGACQAMEDCIVLAKLLQGESSIEKAFKSYESKRIPRTTRVVKESWKFGKASHLENGIKIFIRNLLFRLAPKGALRKQIEFLNNVEF